ncbi:Cytochrome P450 89A2 [Dichanthelium oligosanthes]|uniref:Cytochrome P450 89A2 n=1 Tax=Dichanthelium oligosanthes TaxID=888268 RepID=A0A1E5VMS3_9POAL|nr:Cytochrome P450 89A2 [Dichanthelium oligosanthes]
MHTITSAAYGPLWRVLRRNLAAKVLHPSCLCRHAAARRRAVSGLVAGITRQMRGEGVVVIEGLLHRAMFHVLVSMCFGDDGLDDAVVASVTALQREFLTSVVGFQVFGAWPAVTKLLFWRRLKRMLSIRRRQEELLAPLIRACRERRDAAGDNFAEDCYADSLLGLKIPAEDGGGRNLTESEMVCLCSEFLASGTDSTYRRRDAMDHGEPRGAAGDPSKAPGRDTPGHRCRSGGHRGGAPAADALPQGRSAGGAPAAPAGPLHMLPHAATGEEGGATTLEGFSVPRQASVNFTLAGMALDEAVWPDAKRFRPERFLPGGEGEDVDLTGSKEIKMMPFGAGRRVCPGIGLPLLHLEYFVLSLVRELEWKEVPGEPVELTERLQMSLVMKAAAPCHGRPVDAQVTHAHSCTCTRDMQLVEYLDLLIMS